MIRRAGRFCRRRQGGLEAAAVAAGHAAQALLPNSSKAGWGGPATLQSPGTCVPEMHGMQSAGLPPHNVTQTHAHAHTARHSTGLEVRGTLVARLPDVASRVVAFSGGVNSVCQCDRNFGQDPWRPNLRPAPKLTANQYPRSRPVPLSAPLSLPLCLLLLVESRPVQYAALAACAGLRRRPLWKVRQVLCDDDPRQPVCVLTCHACVRNPCSQLGGWQTRSPL